MTKNKLKPGGVEQWCIGEMTGSYLGHMEEVLPQYALPSDPLRPLICFAERPCFLIGDVGALLPLSPGKAKRHHYEYEKNGACGVLLAFEPHTGFRSVEVRERRTAVDDAQLMQNLIAKHYRHGEHMRLVQDNLHTHPPGSFYNVLPPADAFALGQAFEPHDTPKKGAWLNMAEIEFAALSKQCLDRRLAAGAPLEREVLTWAQQRNHDRTTGQWHFAQTDARQKLQRHSTNIQEFN